MPELPEVETTLRCLRPYLSTTIIRDVTIRQYQLRWPIPNDLKSKLQNKCIRSLSRRGKYLLLHLEEGSLIIHLGMSGCLRILSDSERLVPHAHLDLILANQLILRYIDPRRFGAILWTDEGPLEHPLLKNLGVEPLSEIFTGDFLWRRAKNRLVPIKSLIMNAKIIVGIGNIYAAEALFLARIHPTIPAGSLSPEQCQTLVDSIQQVLQQAIKQGGTTLKDFVDSEGKPGYFSQQLNVYGRAGLPCVRCGAELKALRLAQRSTVFCSGCQK